MAGTLELSKSLCWMPAGWIYDNALEGMAEHVGGELREHLLSSLTDINGGHLDLQNTSADELHAMTLALKALINKVTNAGPNAMHNPEFFDGYLQQLRELDAMLATRLSESSA